MFEARTHGIATGRGRENGARRLERAGRRRTERRMTAAVSAGSTRWGSGGHEALGVSGTALSQLNKREEPERGVSGTEDGDGERSCSSIRPEADKAVNVSLIEGIESVKGH